MKQLTDSGILDGDTIKAFLPPQAEPKDADDLVRELVRHKKLTKYQAEQVYRGKGPSLLLGNYLILDKIGAGGMGQVFKAEHRRMHRIVAVKMLPARLMGDPSLIARFEREVTAAARVNHPNVVAAYDADQAHGMHLLVMEYVEGSDLSAHVKKHGPLKVDQALSAVLQAARVLETAHAAGIVHRDIKPGNLLIDKRGTVKVLDLGLARVGGETPIQADLTNTGTVMGTVDYMAPEQAMNSKDADARADIYSLGCSLHYLLTGKPVYEGDTLMAKLMAHRLHSIPALKALRPEVSDQVQTLFERMVAKQVEDRYQTMADVIADLEKLTGSGPKSAAAQPSSDTFSEAGLTDFLKEIAQSPPIPASQPKARSAGSGQRKSPRWLLTTGGVLAGVVLLAGVVFSLQSRDGTLTITINEPGAQVQILRDDDTAIITREGDRESIRISIVPGKHRLRVSKDGFEIYTDNFEIGSGENKSISARLTPAAQAAGQPAVADSIAGVPFTSVFPGRKDSGWTPAGAPQNWNFDPDQNVLTAAGASPGWLLSPDEYGDFVLQLEHQADPGATSGVAFLTTPDDAQRLEVQIGSGSGRTTGAVWTDPSKTANAEGLLPTTASATEKPAGEWNLLEIELRTRRLKVTVNQVTVLELNVQDLARRNDAFLAWQRGTGRIGLKSQRGRVRFRQVRLAPIGATGPAQLVWKTPAFQQWADGVSFLTPAQQAVAIAEKLQELNPGFDGKVTPRFENSTLTELEFLTDHVTNIAPVRAARQLRTLSCSGSFTPRNGMGQIRDFSPLEGMALTTLVFHNTQLADLTPLRGMPLRRLICPWSQVADLSPLQGMPLVELDAQFTQISELSPLQGMQLEKLLFTGTRVGDLAPLTGMPIHTLHAGFSEVADLAPLRGMPLTGLWCHYTKIADLTPLARSAQLSIFLFNNTNVTDVTPLKDLKLTSVSLTPPRITRGLDDLRRLGTLTTIGLDGINFPAGEFWKKFDAGEFAQAAP